MPARKGLKILSGKSGKISKPFLAGIEEPFTFQYIYYSVFSVALATDDASNVE